MAIAPQRLGAILGLLAALSFGVSAPLAKLLLAEVPPQLLAGLLYLGAGLGLALYRLARPGTREAPLARSDLPSMVGVVALGGVAGPLLLMLGLSRVSGTAGALLLNLEAPLTIVLAAVLFGEHLGRRATLAAVCILLGALVLRVSPGEVVVDTLGVAAIAAACLCWAVDNNLTQRLSLKDPFQVVRIKALAAGTFNTALTFALGAGVPGAPAVALALGLGVLSYGISVVLDAYALRLHGAAREAAYFATAPFAGAAMAVPLLGESLGVAEFAAMGMMATGVVLLLRERHSHEHVHEPLEHEHLHVHDEHHPHEHSPDDPAGEPHAHVHRHAGVIHSHAHTPDLHHRHRH